MIDHYFQMKVSTPGETHVVCDVCGQWERIHPIEFFIPFPAGNAWQRSIQNYAMVYDDLDWMYENDDGSWCLTSQAHMIGHHDALWDLLPRLRPSMNRSTMRKLIKQNLRRLHRLYPWWTPEGEVVNDVISLRWYYVEGREHALLDLREILAGTSHPSKEG